MPSKIGSISYNVRWVDKTIVSDLLLHTTSVTTSNGSYTVGKSWNIQTANNRDWRRKITENPVLTGEMVASFSHSRRGVERAWYWYKEGHSPPGWRYTVHHEGVRQPTLSGVGHDPLLVDQAKNAAYEEILAAYHKQTRSVQGLVNLGEIRETIRLLRRPADAIAALTKRYLKRRVALQKAIRRSSRRKNNYGVSDREHLRRLFDRGVDEYLGYVYGITPLLGDADRAAKYYNRIRERKLSHVVLKTKQKWVPDAKKVVDGPHVVRQNLAYGHTIQFTRTGVSEVWIKLRAGITAAVGPSCAMGAFQQAAIDAGWTARDIVPALWELLPLSFVADYFSNIGDVIDGWSFGDVFPNGLQQTVVRIARQTESGFTMSYTSSSSRRNLGMGINPHAEYEWLDKKITRERLPGLPVPTLEFKLPGDNEAKIYTNLAALVRARTRRVSSNNSSNLWSQGINL